MKIHHIVKQLFPALVIFGLLLGCGGDKDTEKPAGDDQNGGSSSGTQGGGDEKVTLAKFLPGKRLYVEVDAPAPPDPEFEEGPDAKGSSEPPEDRGEDTGEDPSEDKGETPIFADGGFVLQFDKDGKCYAGIGFAGKILGLDEDDGTTYKVSGPKKVTIYEDGKVNGGITFPTAHPKKGDKIKFDEREGEGNIMSNATITKIEDASPMESVPSGGGGPDEPAPEPGDPSEEGLPEAEPVEEKKK